MCANKSHVCCPGLKDHGATAICRGGGGAGAGAASLFVVVEHERRLHSECAWRHLARMCRELRLLPLRAYKTVLRERGGAAQYQVTPTGVGVALATLGKGSRTTEGRELGPWWVKDTDNDGTRRTDAALLRHQRMERAALARRPAKGPPFVVRQRPFVVAPTWALCSVPGNTRLRRGRHVG